MLKHNYAVVLTLMLLLGGGRSLSADVLTIPALTMNPNGVTPLAGVVTLATDVPSRVSLKISGGMETWGVDFPEFALNHSVPVLGLKPATVYTIHVSVTDQLGTRQNLTSPLHVETPPLPADFPKVSAFLSDPSRMEPGYILLDKTRRPVG